MKELKLKKVLDLKDLERGVHEVAVIANNEPHLVYKGKDGKYKLLRVRATSVASRGGGELPILEDAPEYDFRPEAVTEAYLFDSHAEKYQWIADKLKEYTKG